MRIRKHVVGTLTKCYAVAPVCYKGEDCFLVAAEKKDACLLFSVDGTMRDTVWTLPGGTMSIVQVPGSDGAFLATQQFYSPNDSAAARIVYVRPAANGWQVQTVAPLPFVHRFDIISRGGVNYLIACTIKSDHHYKDDWSSPGKVYAAELPDDIARAGAVQPLHFTVVQDGLTKNHGYTRDMHDGVPTAIISAENGVFRFTPPAHRGGTWSVEQLLDTPASDAILCDLDGDGKKELAVMAPFHGDSFAIYAPDGERYRQVYVHPEPMEFLHAIAAGPVCGKERVIIGHREGKRALMAFTFERGAYRAEEIDRDCGPANVCVLRRDGVDVVVSAHRETNEIALYELLP